MKHGYVAYSHGCRCVDCKEAKRSYMAARRDRAWRAALDIDPVPGVTHGTRFAYEERGCRCATCVVAQVNRGRARLPGVAA